MIDLTIHTVVNGYTVYSLRGSVNNKSRSSNTYIAKDKRELVELIDKLMSEEEIDAHTK